MAERYATQSGIWEAATFGGTLPDVGDTVHANNYTVTVDRSIHVTAISTRPGAVAVAGGGFTFSTPNITATCNAYAGTTNCIGYNASSGTLNLIGNMYGSNTTGSAYALNHNSAGELILTGNCYGGSVTSSIAAVAVSTGGATIYGHLYGGSASGGSSHGFRWVNNGSGIFRLFGHCYGATAGTNSGGFSGAGLATSPAYIYGNCFGDVGPGLTISTAGNVYVFGDATGGTVYNCGGLWISGSSTGNIYLYGTARSSPTGKGPGAYNSSTGAACISVQAAETGAGGGWPLYGKVIFNDLSNVAFGVRNVSGTLKSIGVKGSRGPFRTRQVFGGLTG